MIAETKETGEGSFCSRISLASQEQLIGTASPVQFWFLLQYAYPWSVEPFPASRLPDVVNRRFEELGRKSLSKLLLIKQGPRVDTPPLFYIGVNNAVQPRLYRFQLERYEDLLDIDVEGLLNGTVKYEPQTEPLVLVCTHGTHDRCCAKFGLPIYREASNIAGAAAWQCSHVGGDRFAANMLLYPHGLYYGHVERTEVADILSEYRQGRIYPGKYRGRSCYGMPVQAAEFFLRVQTQDNRLHAFLPIRSSPSGPNRWEVRFESADRKALYTLEVERTQSIYSIYASCRSDAKSQMPQYRLLRFRSE